ncbi:MAG: hypothetical protein KBD66_00890 [Candidatus Doudnabacteria bacterium]|nr:hypothetical protein [Candidatus Doudnabacteria bacterium]
MSTKQINLLPKEQQKELVLRGWFRNLLRVYMLALASFVLVILLFFGATSYLSLQGRGLQSEAEELRALAATDEATKIKLAVKAVNGYVDDYLTLVATAPKWSQLFREFTHMVPSGVQVQSFTVDATRKQVTIQGFGATREQVLSLYDALVAASDRFTNVDYPLENVARPTNINFHYSFTVKDQVLQ